MKLFFTVMLLLAGGLGSGHAQTRQAITLDMVAKAYEDSTIYLVGTDKYFKAGEQYRTGAFLRYLRAEIKKSPEAFESYKICRRKKWRGSMLMTGSLVFGIMVLSLTATPAGILLLIPYSFGVVDILDSERHFRHAVWILNRDQLLKALQASR